MTPFSTSWVNFYTKLPKGWVPKLPNPTPFIIFHVSSSNMWHRPYYKCLACSPQHPNPFTYVHHSSRIKVIPLGLCVTWGLLDALSIGYHSTCMDWSLLPDAATKSIQQNHRGNAYEWVVLWVLSTPFWLAFNMSRMSKCPNTHRLTNPLVHYFKPFGFILSRWGHANVTSDTWCLFIGDVGWPKMGPLGA